MRRTLLLNADWTPLNFVSPFRAMNLLFKGRAEVINMGGGQSTWKEFLRSPSTSFEIPATLRLVERVNRKYTAPRFRKWVLFNRDEWQCQYCGVKLSGHEVTIDHVTPRARGGPTSWRNCVTSCKRCNWKKGSRLPSEAGMPLRKNPSEPKIIHFWELGHPSNWHPDWTTFFGPDIYGS